MSKKEQNKQIDKAIEALTKGLYDDYFNIIRSFCVEAYDLHLYNSLRNQFLASQGGISPEFWQKLKVFASGFYVPIENDDEIGVNKIQKKIWLMGPVASGKTSFLLGLYRYLMLHCAESLKILVDNIEHQEGKAYLEQLLYDWDNYQKLPKATDFWDFHQIKFSFTHDSDVAIVCELEIIDFSGEDMSFFNKTWFPTVAYEFFKGKNAIKLWFISTEALTEDEDATSTQKIQTNAQHFNNMISLVRAKNLDEFPYTFEHQLPNTFIVVSKYDLYNPDLHKQKFDLLVEETNKNLYAFGGSHITFSLGDFSEEPYPTDFDLSYYVNILEKILEVTKNK